MGSPFQDGERVLLLDARGRRYLVVLRAGGQWHSHGGGVVLDEIIGREPGCTVRSGSDMVFEVFRPRLADISLKMPRGAAIVYPKDVGAILTEGDIGLGHRVLEAGTGSGALTLALARAVGPTGLVASYDLREDFQETARRNLIEANGSMPPWVDLRSGDVIEVPTTERFDRVVLDLPSPWEALDALGTVAEPGAVLVSYLPTIIQSQSLVMALDPAGFRHLETFEVLHRSWHVTGRSVRPDHRMVAHTAFITVARRIAPTA